MPPPCSKGSHSALDVAKRASDKSTDELGPHARQILNGLFESGDRVEASPQGQVAGGTEELERTLKPVPPAIDLMVGDSN